MTNQPIEGQVVAQEPEPVQEFDIRINTHALTFGDIEMAMKFESGDVPVAEILPFLNRIVVGGVRDIPLDAMPAIMDALTKAFSEMGNPKN
jgi:hypothetical protein